LKTANHLLQLPRDGRRSFSSVIISPKPVRAEESNFKLKAIHETVNTK
jgi:hypothetical protein